MAFARLKAVAAAGRAFTASPPRAGDMAKVSLYAALLTLLFVFTGCGATREYEDPGWRYAVIVDIGRHGDLATTAGHDCSDALWPDAPYFIARYRDGQHSRTIGKAQRPADGWLRIGQDVRVNVLDCNAAVIPLSASEGPP